MTHIHIITAMDRECLVGTVTDGATTGAGVATGIAVRGMVTGGIIATGTTGMAGTKGIAGNHGGTDTAAKRAVRLSDNNVRKADTGIYVVSP
jgi:hypothetical protein